MDNTKISTIACVLIFVVAIGSLVLVSNFHVYKAVFAKYKENKI